MTRVSAVLPSAGRIAPPFSDEAGASVKALIELGGKTLLERAIVALRDSGVVERIVVVGPPDVRGHAASQLADLVLEDGGEHASGPDNIFRAIEHLPQNAESRALVVTTDLPFLTPEAVRNFVQSCPHDKEACISACEKRSFDARFPDLGGEWVRLQDGEWTIGGLYLLDVAALTRAHPHIERIFHARKSQWQMARLLGPVFIARWLTKRMGTTHILQRCERIVGCSGAAVVCAPELAFDVDNVDEYRYAKKVLEA